MYYTKGGTRRPQDLDIQHRLIQKVVEERIRASEATTADRKHAQGANQMSKGSNRQHTKTPKTGPGLAHVLQTLAIHASLRVEHFMLAFVATIRPDPGAAYKVSPRILNPAYQSNFMDTYTQDG
jgi:hypothetical protein